MFNSVNASPSNVWTKHKGCTVHAPIYSESLPPLIVGSTFLAEGKKVGQGKVMFEVIHSGGQAPLIIRWHWLTPGVRSFCSQFHPESADWSRVSTVLLQGNQREEGGKTEVWKEDIVFVQIKQSSRKIKSVREAGLWPCGLCFNQILDASDVGRCSLGFEAGETEDGESLGASFLIFRHKDLNRGGMQTHCPPTYCTSLVMSA